MAEGEPRLSEYFNARGVQLGLPVGGNFELTARCNFGCKMCYVRRSADEVAKLGGELTADQWLSIASDARDAGMLFLLLTGGEPLIRDDFEYIFTELAKMGLMISVNTNASLLEGERLEFFRHNPPTRFNITLYGTDNATYERLCGNAAFDRVIKNIRAVREIGIPVRMNCSITPDNAGELEKIYEVSRELNVNMKAASYMFPPVRRCGDGSSYRCSAEDAGKLDFEWDRLRFERDKFVERAANLKAGIRNLTEEECEGAPGEGIMCRAGRSTFWLTWDGRMTPCGMIPEPAAYPLKIGFKSAWDTVRKAASEIRLPPECTICPVRHACHVCAASAYTETGRFDGVPEYICRMVKRHLECTIAEYNRLTKETGDED